MYVMMSCPPDWKDSNTRNRCEHPDARYSDPLLDAPVTSLSTNITYRNWHCASCHRDLDVNTMVIWNAEFECHTGLHEVVPDETLSEHLVYNPFTSEWNLNISKSFFKMKSRISTQEPTQVREDNKDEILCACQLTFRIPTLKLQTYRLCKINIISRCSEDWKDINVKTHCEAYTARICSGIHTYRNLHCLKCNNVVAPEPCRPVFFYATNHEPQEPGLSFTMLLDWRRLKRGTCASSEIYDPLSHVCREVFI